MEPDPRMPEPDDEEWTNEYAEWARLMDEADEEQRDENERDHH